MFDNILDWWTNISILETKVIGEFIVGEISDYYNDILLIGTLTSGVVTETNIIEIVLGINKFLCDRILIRRDIIGFESWVDRASKGLKYKLLVQSGKDVIDSQDLILKKGKVRIIEIISV